MKTHKTLVKLLFTAALTVVSFLNSFAQVSQSQCDNSDFFYGNFNNWSGFTGNCCPVNVNTPGIVNGQHTIINTPGPDPNSCGGVLMLPPGVTSVARLGNATAGYGAERLRYQIAPVTPGNALFIYNYAVIYENPCSGHSCSEMPSFSVRVTNAAGQLVDPNCANYSYKPCNCGGSAGSFGTCGGWKYQDWRTAALDLTAYIGSTINIDFATNDCGQGGHAGYAYIYGACQALIIDVAYCAGSNQVLLTAPNGFASYQWYKTNTPGTILGSAQTLTITSPVIGDQYTCRVTTFAGCVITLTSQIQPSIIVTDFDFTTACAGEIVNFYDLSSVNNSQITTWLWDFGDGTTSTLQNPTHVFPTGGSKPVTLTAGSGAGCTQTLTQNVTVTSSPTAQFTVANSNTPPPFVACIGVPVNFSNNTTTNSAIAGYNWDFGCCTATSLAQSPTYTYSVAGTFDVTLTATDNNGCIGTVMYPIIINPNPLPDFTVPPICQNTPTTFTDATIIPSGAAIANIEWNFGTFPHPTGTTCNHTFNIPGVANVGITATDANGCTGSTQLPVTVNPLPQPGFTNTTACFGTATAFTDATPPPASGITSWVWDFGDGPPAGTDVVPNPQYLYASAGDYNVGLTVTDGIGCINTFNKLVHVGNIPVADFMFAETCLGDPTCFTDNSPSSTDPIFTFTWDFGTVPASQSTSFNPCNIYLASGTYQVTYATTTSFNCTSLPVTYPLIVHDIPTADFASTSVCAGFQTDFTDASTILTDNIVAWDWSIAAAPPVTMTGQTPNYTFNTGGSVNVTLTATSDANVTNPNGTIGCIGSVQKQVIIHHRPYSNFNATTVCEGVQTTFTQTASVSAPDQITIYDWNMNNGEYLDNVTPNPVYVFNSYGTKPVNLKVTTDQGCIDDTTQNVLVYSLPVADFSYNDTCEGLPISFQNLTTNADGSFTNYWDFDNVFITFPYNTQSSPQSLVFTTAGPYDVVLTATSSHGCTNTATKNVRVFPNPQANFITPAACRKSSSMFTDSSYVSNLFADAIAEWAWDFGDGPPPGIDSVQNPQYIYPDFGIYTVHLDVKTNNGCSASLDKDIQVYPIPFVSFQSDPACSTHANVFYNTTQMDVTGSISSWNWDFAGLGSATDSATSYLFPNAGTFDVTLSATTNKNCTIDTTIPVLVNPLPLVDFAKDTLIGCQPLTVGFEDLNPSPTGYTVSYWNWNFGDSHFSNDGNRPSNTYDSYGDFDIQLILTTADGCKDSLTKVGFLTVWPKPIANFNISPQPTSELDAWITFTDQSLLEVNQWWWDFGVEDSTNDVSTMPSPMYLYGDSGTYETELMVENRFGCRDTIIRPVVIDPEFVFYIPNAFTPNDSRDTLNEVFNGYGTGIQDYEMRIYNRWGESVYKSRNQNVGWAGVDRNTADVAPQGTYVYVFEITDVNKKFHVYRGHVTLIRSR